MHEVMKKLIYILLALVALLPAGASAEGLFVYPSPPDSVMNLQPRCDYIISRFWDRCNFDQALVHPAEFNKAFGDWVGIMPHASADTVHASIDRLLARFAKKGADKTLALAQLAENWVYSDTSQLYSEEIMLPFATAAAHHKKIDKKERAHFAAIEKVLSSINIGCTLPDLAFTRADGSEGKLSDVCRGSVLLFLNEPDEPECSFMRIRFDTDPNTRELIEDGELTIITVYPLKADEKWTSAAKDYPANWQNVAIEDFDEYFGKVRAPQLYFLNSARKMLAKGMSQDYLLGAFKYTNENRARK